MSDNSRIAELIAKERLGSLSESDRLELQAWINISALNRWWYEEMTDEENMAKGVASYAKAVENEDEILLKVIPQKEQAARPAARLVKWPFIRHAAAAAIVLISAGTALWYFYVPAKERTPLAAVTGLVHDLPPGGNKAVLTLANGSKVLLDNAGMGLVSRRGNVRVVKVDSGEVAYQVGVHNATDEVGQAADNVLSTPLGGQYKLLLSDGTKVWLNAASSLHFPAVFKGNERRVELTGEAYFEVAENKKMPFSVVAGGMKVQVLGTSFNLKAYPDEKKVTATLVNGTVQVFGNDVSKMLTPGDQATLSEQGQLSLHSNADLEEAVAWKNGQFIFNSDAIGTIVQQVSRWYNIPVQYTGRVPGGTFSGRIRRSAPLSHVLQMLSYEGIHAEIQQGVLVIK